MSNKRTGLSVAADSPIRTADHDVLGRADFARSFAEQVLAFDASEGVVVGVLGAWGSGKTSFVNLARVHWEQLGIAVLDFNPWMFSGAEQLVESFFIELSSQLKLHPGLAEIGEFLEDYGEGFSKLSWLPIVGSWIDRAEVATTILGKYLQRRKQGVGNRKSRIEKALREVTTPIVLVIDDIDRLSTSEIRDVFKLVRLTANFPNIIYIVVFDRMRVEEALSEQGIPGRDYLEKILQIGVDLPALPAEVLNSQVLEVINGALSTIENTGPFDEHAWPDVYMEVIHPLLRNMRDVRRYAAAVYGAVRSLEGRIALVDVLALEAIRVFLPDTFRELPGTVDALTQAANVGYGRVDETDLKRAIERLTQSAGNKEEVIRALVKRCFPAGERHMGGMHYVNDWSGKWLRSRRVAHPAILRLYLERVVGERLQAFTDSEHAWKHMPDACALDAFLRSLNPERLQDVISALEAYEDQFAPEHIISGTTVLLNISPDLPDRPRGMYGLDTRMVVTRVVYRLLRALKDPDAVEAAVRTILPDVTTLSSKLELITIIGHLEGAGHKLVSEPVARAFGSEWRDEVRAATPDELARERELLRIVLRMKRDAEPPEAMLEVANVPAMTLAMLRSARSDVHSQSVDSRAVRRYSRLPWKLLLELFGDEDTIRTRIEQLREAKLEDSHEVLELADQYLAGARTDDEFGGD
jgi:predicted KAP-like P-loop ATPase